MRAFKICRIFGVTVKAHWSLLVLIILLTEGFNAILMDRYQEVSIFSTIFISIVFALCLVVSVLAHEVGHVFVGHRLGVPFDTITLFLFGGAAHMKEFPKTAKVEALMALAGPATSIVLAAITFALFTVAVGVFGLEDGPMALFASILIYANVILGVLNLVPALPLDGGRVLRAIFWWRKRDLLHASKMATQVSKALSYCIMLTGILMAFGVSIPFFGSGDFGGIWIFVLGLLVRFMAKQELKMVRHFVLTGRRSRY